MAKGSKAEGVRSVVENRKARHDYIVDDEVEAGLVLLGSEVKSLRAGGGSLVDAYASITRDELYLQNAHIAPYKQASSAFGHEPRRARKLLLHRDQIDKWTGKVRERGYTIIPLRLYFKDGRAKVQLGLCRGKTQVDRRHTIRERDSRREVERALRRR